jgi:hypothetical protein
LATLSKYIGCYDKWKSINQLTLRDTISGQTLIIKKLKIQ